MSRNDDTPGPLTDDMAVWYIKQGVTPRAVENVYRRMKGVRSMASGVDASQDDILRLAERWGIKRNGIIS